MFVKVKSPSVARRLRGYGSMYEVQGVPTPFVTNARHFKPKGLDFDELCRAGRVSIWFEKHVAPAQVRYLMHREVTRQTKISAAIRAEMERDAATVAAEERRAEFGEPNPSE